jgi:KDO2-lipid IV(A) lauroyltransferase
VTAGLNAGRGVILALPHLGGWEWAGRWLACRSIEVVAVAERLEPEELFAWMTELRNDLGMTVVPLDSSAGSAVLAALRRNAVVCLLCDRDLQGGGAEVEFFGERTTIPAGPAALALRTGATLLPTAVLHTDRGEGHLGLVLPPLDTARDERPLRTAISDVSNELAAALESLIRRAPTQWHLLQPNWPSDT